LEGGLHARIVALREALIAIRAVIEVAIDFPDEDVEIINPRQMLDDLRNQVIAPLHDLVNAAERGKIFREGISVVILGRPNVGKSSLLNSLLREDRAIVTEIPGTTRDIIEEYLDIKGIPVRIIDTAGIRQGAEAVEEIGIRKARQKLESADLVLLVVDGAGELSDEDRALAGIIGEQPAILVVNKVDLAPGKDLHSYRASFPRFSAVEISAKTGQGLARLEEAIFAAVSGGGEQSEPDHACVPNVRHAASLAASLAATRQLAGALRENLPPDLVALEVQAALDHLGDIIGETTTDDILEMIFTRFCLGK
ncbi:MAG: 50S ribosome-binding GTPase, partial [Desulfobulbaceae bacterium]|nr:50S ribosome-binding GTPase [Desulfobulbaceae bacterium]